MYRPPRPFLREEIFGPVVPIVTLADETEAMQSGLVGLNRGLVSGRAAPFGGTRQASTYIAVTW